MFKTYRVLHRCNKEKNMLELIGWIKDGTLMDKLTSPLFWLTLGAFCMAGHYIGKAMFEPQEESGQK
ncbi:hypothetical protein WJ17_14225 [Burkholderia vietnamiensis]|nr:hypothetical protein WJ17_14225 [Burkholderia vietnamiensis]KVS21208.1 hypothetical protein WK34_22800 [Burkholderia vietnamiensis]